MNKPAINIENTLYPVLELPGRPKALLDRTVAIIFQINKEIKVKYIILLLVTLACLNAQQDISSNSLILSLTNSSKVISLNTPLTTTMTVKNTSSQVLSNLQLELKLPNALQSIPSQPHQNTKKTFRWKISELGAQQTKVFKITTRGVLQGVYLLKASLSIPYNGLLLNICQRDALIKIASFGSRVGPQYDTDDPVGVGQQTTYVFTLKNEGTSEATMIWGIDHIPQQMEFVRAEGPTEYWYDPQKKTVIFFSR
ncbi:hypothetical protein [Candidatus Uabimicrobium sp. HlEnr_7]|uniref:hypothetical protein n=1 Tax=Candidatus Uabimicrobium helgolandensis TaxID=3095367 RepID=UPI0035592B63